MNSHFHHTRIDGKALASYMITWNPFAEELIAHLWVETDQIKEKKYIASLEPYIGDILLVGINYDKKTKKNECLIEKA